MISEQFHSGDLNVRPEFSPLKLQFYRAFLHLRLSLSFFSSCSLLLPADVWNVYSHMECVCKSHGNQISLIPGGLNKVAFVCMCVGVCVCD